MLAIGLLLASFALLAFFASLAYQHFKTQHLRLAAGSASAESYIVCTALKTVVERHYPRIKIAVAETGGTVESLNMLEGGGADLAAAQADVLAGPSARILAVLGAGAGAAGFSFQH